MSKINILDKSVFNKIAAGEVVEKPASVVKELLDNSIDAGADKIEIKIVDGGIKNITITDNGSGILPDDFDKVFLAHATSKIKTVDDLAKIGTLGFRGEALASIASVSNVELISKVETEIFGRKCTVSGGEQSDVAEVGADNGTKISVSDLFFNVPARAKFLRKPRTETTEITNLVQRYILCNPDKSFLYVADGKTICQSTGGGLFDAIYVVYGKQASDSIIKVDSTNRNSGIRVSGYIGLPTFSKPNRTYQTLSVNHRFVNSSMVSTCIANAYEHFLMKGQFPFYVLNIQIPLDKLDVNVHPSKMEVRFENSNEIYGNVYSAVSSALFECEKITTPQTTIKYKSIETGGVSFAQDSLEQKNPTESKKIDTISQPVDIFVDDKRSQSRAKNILDFSSEISSDSIDFATGEIREPSSPILNSMFQKHTIEQTMLDDSNQNADDEVAGIEKSKTQEFFETSDLKFVGTIFATYLIVEKQDKVYVIDEHAGHERLLFDRLVKQVDSQQVSKQNLLVPYTINTNQQEYDFVEDNIDSLQKLGFDIAPFGDRTFIVHSIPAILRDIDLNQFFASILTDLSKMKELKQSDLVLRELMQHSCKCAVRAGKILSSGEVNSLIEQMKQEKMQLQCPHGRPVVVELTKSQIEKWFKRIV